MVIVKSDTIYSEKITVLLRRQDLLSSMGRFPLYQSNFHVQKDAQSSISDDTKKSVWKILDPNGELSDKWYESKKVQVMHSLHECIACICWNIFLISRLLMINGYSKSVVWCRAQ